MDQERLSRMTLAEKLSMLTGGDHMETHGVERLGIPAKRMADGPHGVRSHTVSDCVAFPNLCSVAATWDVALTEALGTALGSECVRQNIDMLLGPGVNIKRHILCGRNFEYFSEDPVLAGELGAAYINGLQETGVAACLKHFACNNQEKDRQTLNVELDERTLREIYLKAFEIAVKKANPMAVMCAYNRVNSLWCGENRYLLTDILKKEWGFEGLVISDWGAVQNTQRSVKAGLDLEMPRNQTVADNLKKALEDGAISGAEMDEAVSRVLRFSMAPKAPRTQYDRQAQHTLARKIAAAGIVLMKNERNVLPLTPEKYRNIAVVGEFASAPIISGQGSAEVNTDASYIDSPLKELQAMLGENVNLRYYEGFGKRAYSDIMLWPQLYGCFAEFLKPADVVLFFIGSMVSEDTEKLDRRSAFFNPNYEMFIEAALDAGKKVIVVMQTGSAMVLNDWHTRVDGLVEMWLGGEGAGGAIADVLTGKVNPSGKLPETFPNRLRTDLEYPGSGGVVEYRERFEVGYRYYDAHPTEVAYPFGHGLSYTTFSYGDIHVEKEENEIRVSVKITNTGMVDGDEIVQLYIGGFQNSVRRPIKELKAFHKVHLKTGQTQKVAFCLCEQDFGFYNVTVKDWVTEAGNYKIYVGASATDIRCAADVDLEGNAEYTLRKSAFDRIG